jgi:hypothetical protein
MTTPVVSAPAGRSLEGLETWPWAAYFDEDPRTWVLSSASGLRAGLRASFTLLPSCLAARAGKSWTRWNPVNGLLLFRDQVRRQLPQLRVRMMTASP